MTAMAKKLAASIEGSSAQLGVYSGGVQPGRQDAGLGEPGQDDQDVGHASGQVVDE